jgi:hypothetical protein
LVLTVVISNDRYDDRHLVARRARLRNDRHTHLPLLPVGRRLHQLQGRTHQGQAPLVTHGFHDATTDLEQVTRWWKQYPFAMIGRMVPLDQICIDVDPWKGGSIEALKKLVAELPFTQCTWSGRGNGGMHYFFLRPIGELVSTKLPKGIDLRVGGNHYTIVAPSVHPVSGGQYEWICNPNPQPCTDHLAALLAKPEDSQVKRAWKTGEAVGYMDSGDGPLSRGQISGILRKVGTAPNGSRKQHPPLGCLPLLRAPATRRSHSRPGRCRHRLRPA